MTSVDDRRYIVMCTDVCAALIAAISAAALSLGSTMIFTPLVPKGGGPASTGGEGPESTGPASGSCTAPSGSRTAPSGSAASSPPAVSSPLGSVVPPASGASADDPLDATN